MNACSLARRTPYGAGLLALFFALGFDLDRGELLCEQTAAHLLECCPELQFDRTSCIQPGGCDRVDEETLVSSDESDCIQDLGCVEIAERDICGRIEERIALLDTPKGPTIQELYRADPVCQ
jgi:hypothetical protein